MCDSKPVGPVRRLGDENGTDKAQASEHLATILDSIPDALIALDREWKFTYANAEAERLLGHKRSELTGRHLQQFPATVPSAFYQQYRQVVSEQAPATFEEFYSPCNTWYEISACPSGDGLIVSFRDIGSRKASEACLRDKADRERTHTEEMLRLSQEQFKTMGEIIAYGVWMADADGHSTYVSQSFLDLLGMTIEQVKEYGWISRLPRENVPAVLGRWVHCIRTGDDWEYELRFPGPDGVRTILSHGKPLRGPNGQIVAWAGINLDITDRKRAQEDLERLRRESERVARVNLMGEFASTLAHELNQMLAAILSNAQAASRFLDSGEPDLRELRQILVDIANEDKRAGDIIRQMRAIVRKSDSQPETVQLNDVVREVVSLLNSEFVRCNLVPELDLHPLAPPVQACHVEIQQVLLNLAINALDAMKETPSECRRLAFVTEHDGRGVTVAVRDSGMGIASGHHEAIFEPLFTTKPDGMGMGLAICKRIVEARGGRLRAESNQDAGATFILTLPAETADEAEGK